MKRKLFVFYSLWIAKKVSAVFWEAHRFWGYSGTLKCRVKMFFMRKHIREINCTYGTSLLTELQSCVSIYRSVHVPCMLLMASHCLKHQVQTPQEGSPSPARVCQAYFSNLTSHSSPPPRLHTPWEHSLLFHAYLLLLHQRMPFLILSTGKELIVH